MTTTSRYRLRNAAALAAAAPLAWAAYSALAIDHDMPIAEALPGRRRVHDAPTAGPLAYYEEDGPAPAGSAPPLLLLHSINAAASSYEMRPLWDYYRQRRRVYALELPGFGFSARAARRYDPDLYVAAIIEFLEGVVNAAQGTDVVALSLTAEFVALAAMRRPELFRRLVLISPTGFDEPAHALEGARRTGWSERIAPVVQARPLAQPLFDLLVSRPSLRYFLARQTEGPVDPGLEEHAWRTAHQPGARHAPLAFLSGALFTPDIRRVAYERLALPVLVLHDRSVNTSYEALPAMVARHDNWRAERIGPARDLVHFDRPASTTRAMDEFFAEEMLPVTLGAEEITEDEVW
jgi:pimeloyl-ACP methyl ester carboxylesterase